MDEAVATALEELTGRGRRLRDKWHLDWPEPVQQAVHRLRLESTTGELPTFAAVVGGASSGKSTVFNNLLGGCLASRITARGHATLGPILAIHEDQRRRLDPLLDEGLLLPGYRRVAVELDDNVTGAPGALSILYHQIDAIRDVLLFDTPDFTSQAAAKEGDVVLTLLPWFDRLVIVVDHERWFDRQSISKLRMHSTRFDQDRFVLFNRTREGRLAEADQAALRRQADRLAARGMAVLEFRRGRGFCVFAPTALVDPETFLNAPKRQRTAGLLRHVAEAANRALKQNQERAARLQELRDSLEPALHRTLPSTRECMRSLMTSPERRQLEVAARVFRVSQTAEWVRTQQERIGRALGRMPVLGPLVRSTRVPAQESLAEVTDRRAVAAAYYESVARQQINGVQRALRSSAFWDELRRWTGLEPASRQFQWSAAVRDEVRSAADAFDTALGCWTAKVEEECQGIIPHVRGAVGLGAVALAIVLIAVPGPLAALTLLSASGAIGSALGGLATATGAGAIAGKHMGRLVLVVREKLLGSPEFQAVQAAAAGFREQLESTGRRLVDDAAAEAFALVMGDDEPLLSALEALA